MNRVDLRRLSHQFGTEARVLLRGRAYHGAYYLAGYAVECALKAVITRRFRRSEFPDRDLVNRLYTHDLNGLLHVAGLRSSLVQAGIANRQLVDNWATVSDWSESKRYDPGITVRDATEMVEACFSPPAGILTWLETYW